MHWGRFLFHSYLLFDFGEIESSKKDVYVFQFKLDFPLFQTSSILETHS